MFPPRARRTNITAKIIEEPLVNGCMQALSQIEAPREQASETLIHVDERVADFAPTDNFLARRLGAKNFDA
jgi:hypothetical protein